MSVADRLGLMWLCVNVHFGSGQRYSPFLCGRFRRPSHRSTYTSTSSGASPAELASPLNGCVPLAAPIRSAVSHCWSSSSRAAAFRSRSRANRCMLSTSSFANSRAILRRRNTDFSSCAVFAKWPPNRMRLSPSARHSMPPHELLTADSLLYGFESWRGGFSTRSTRSTRLIQNEER